MKKNLLIAGMGAMLLASIAMGQAWEKVVKVTTGGYPSVVQTAVPTTGSTLFMDATVKRADSICRNTGSYTVRIGSNAAGTTLGDFGFPVKEDEVFKIGSNSSAWYGIAETGSSQMTCLEGKIN